MRILTFYGLHALPPGVLFQFQAPPPPGFDAGLYRKGESHAAEDGDPPGIRLDNVHAVGDDGTLTPILGDYMTVAGLPGGQTFAVYEAADLDMLGRWLVEAPALAPA